MALIFMAGFEWGNCEEFDHFQYANITTDRRGGNYACSSANNSWLMKYLPQSETELFVQVAFKFTYLNNMVFLTLNKADIGAVISVKRMNSGFLGVYKGFENVFLFSGSKVYINQNYWYILELRVKIHSTNGVIEMRVDGIDEGGYTGNTTYGSATSVNQFWIGGGAPMEITFDDIVIFNTQGSYNNSWPGGLRVKLLRPVSDDGTNQWNAVPAGSHYATVNKVPPQASNYLETDAADRKERFGLSDLDSNDVYVAGVRVDSYCQRYNSGTPDKLKVGLNISDTDYMSSPYLLPYSSRLLTHYFDANPAGGPWTRGAVNNAKLVLESA